MSHCSNVEPNPNDLKINEHDKMGNCTNEEDKRDEEFDISDSEIKEYKEAVYKLLKFRNYNVRAPNGQFSCPFCVDEEKQEYHRLLEHAVRVAEECRVSGKQRANHTAMTKYLVIDLASEAERLYRCGKKMLSDIGNEIDLVKEELHQLQSEYEVKIMSIRRMLEEKDESLRTLLLEGRYLLRMAKDQSKRVLEQQEMLNLDFEKKKRQIDSWKEELNKREAALTREKRKIWKAAPALKPDKRNAKKAMKDPNKPKRPASAFFCFMEDFRETYKKKHPHNKSVSAVGIAGGEKWKSMSEAERAPYVAKAEKKKQEYEEHMNCYNKKQYSQDSSDDEGSEDNTSCSEA